MEIKDGTKALSQVRELIEEYTAKLQRDLSFQHLEEELSDLSSKYAPPHGVLLLAEENGTALGIAAYCRHTASRCEMKRLYVRPQARGRSLGETLVRHLLAQAAADGYTEMVLDTIEPLQVAIHLYEKLGFQRCEPYYHNPMPDVVYMKKQL